MQTLHVGPHCLDLAQHPPPGHAWPHQPWPPVPRALDVRSR